MQTTIPTRFSELTKVQTILDILMQTLTDQYLTEARQSDDPEVRKEAYDKFQVELANDPAYAFICYIDANYVADADIQELTQIRLWATMVWGFSGM